MTYNSFKIMRLKNEGKLRVTKHKLYCLYYIDREIYDDKDFFARFYADFQFAKTYINSNVSPQFVIASSLSTHTFKLLAIPNILYRRYHNHTKDDIFIIFNIIDVCDIKSSNGVFIVTVRLTILDVASNKSDLGFYFTRNENNTIREYAKYLAKKKYQNVIIMYHLIDRSLYERFIDDDRSNDVIAIKTHLETYSYYSSDVMDMGLICDLYDDTHCIAEELSFMPFASLIFIKAKCYTTRGLLESDYIFRLNVFAQYMNEDFYNSFKACIYTFTERDRDKLLINGNIIKLQFNVKRISNDYVYDKFYMMTNRWYYNNFMTRFMHY